MILKNYWGRAAFALAFAVMAVSVFSFAVPFVQAAAIGTYDQCSNDDGDGYATGNTDCRWVNGNLNANNSTYFEGDATVQRLWEKGYVPGSSHSVTFHYGTTKAGKHAYDFLTSWDHSEDWIGADLCEDIAGCLTASVDTAVIPQDPSANGYDNFLREFEMRGGTITNVSTPTLVSGSYAGDSETAITVTFTVDASGDMCSTKSNVTTCDIALFFGAHVSDSADWMPELTAIDIPGSPYHVALAAEDGASVGQRDNQMQTDAIVTPQGTISGVKFNDLNGNGQKDPEDAPLQNWQITLNPGNVQVNTDVSGLYTFANLADGVYTICETQQGGWTQTFPASDTGSCAGGNGYAVTIVGGVNSPLGSLDFGNTQSATLTLVKQVVNNNGGTAPATAWTLTATGPTSPISGTTGSGAVTNVPVQAGSYDLSESGGPAGYSASDWVCTGTGTQTGASIALDGGESAVCTITNDDISPTLTLVKIVTNDNGGVAQVADFVLKIDGNTVTSGVSNNVNAGNHTASEINLPGYTASAWGGDCAANGTISLALAENATCTITNDDQQATITVVKVVTNDNGGTAQPNDFNLTLEGNAVTSGVAVPVNPGTYTAGETLFAGYTFSGFSGDCDQNGDVTVALGESKTCTLTNNDIAPSLTLVKVVTNDNGGTAVATDWILSANGPTSISGAGGAASDATFDAGVYALSESAGPAGYSASDWVCVGGTQNGANITLALAQSATCTITNNDQPGTLTIVKNTVGGNGTFGFTVAGPTPSTPNILTVGNTGTTGAVAVNAGNYSVSETTIPAGWDLTNAVCTSGTPESFTVTNGANVTCTFTNTERGHVIIVKDVIGNPDPTDFTFNNDFGNGNPAAFMLDEDLDGTLPSSRNFEVLPGTYAVSEDPTEGWQLEGATCSDGSPVGAIVVGAGETVTCTFVNEELISITLIKNTTGGNRAFVFTATGDGLPANIELTTVGETATQVFGGLDQDNEYSIVEVVPEGWVLVSAVCTGGETPASITPEAGEDVTCTFTNAKPEAHITISPLTATNNIHDAHIFTVTVTQIPNGATPALTANITTAVNPVPDLTNTTTCGPAVAFVANVATCTITINSSVPEVFTASASATFSIGGVQFVRATDGAEPNSGNATKTYVAGSLEITKDVVGLVDVVNGSTVDDTFTVTVTGPSYPGGHDIVFTLTDGVLSPASVVLENLIPGNYTITEADAGAEWTETVPANAVAVVANETAEATVTNTYVPGALEVSKIVQLNGYLFPLTVDGQFTIQVTGPSYPAPHDVVITVVDGVPTNSPHTLQNLIPGAYTVTEVGADEAAWTVSGNGNVNVVAGQTAQKAITNSLKIPNTTIAITPDVYETEPGQNVILTITDTNDGQTAITSPAVELLANNVLTVPQPTYVGGDTNLNTIMDIGETWTWTVSLMISVNTEFVVNGMGFDALGNPVNGPTYASETDSVTVRVIGTTRTIGFWQTHTNFTSEIFNEYLVTSGNAFVGVNVPVGVNTHKGQLTSVNQLFGGFYAPIAKKTTGQKRTPIDQARIQMLQQLLAAKLNCAAFGCSATTQTLIASADAAYAAGASKGTIIALAGQLDAFNNSGDDNAIPAELPATGKATPKTSQSLADKAFWDLP